MIYHGWTLTSKLKFKDVIEQGIKPFAFTTSEYPLILSIENHCSKAQQDTMGKHLKNILGHFLYKEKVDTSLQNLPSPEFFKRKILIKAKKQKDPKGKILREVQSSPNLSDLPKHLQIKEFHCIYSQVLNSKHCFFRILNV